MGRRLVITQAISVGRAACGLLFASIALLPDLRWGAVLVYLVGSVSDFMDGYLARRWDCATSIGGALDVFGDKALTISSLLFIAARGFALLPCLLFTVRELLLLSIRSVCLNGKPIIPLTGALGGITLTPIRLITLFILLSPRVGQETLSVGNTLLWIGASLSLLSLSYTIIKNRKNIALAFSLH